MTVPQIGGMYAGDASRKKTLVDFGFRLPSAKDNRPLKFNEFEENIGQVIYTSATPSKYEIEKSALPYLARLQGMHPEMASVQILEQVNNFTDEDFVIKAMEIAPYANSKNVSRVITYCRYSRDSCNK